MLSPEILKSFSNELMEKAAELPKAFYRPNEFDTQHALPGIARRHGNAAANRVAAASRDKRTTLALNLMKIYGDTPPKRTGTFKTLGSGKSWDAVITERQIEGRPSFTPQEMASLRKNLQARHRTSQEKAQKASFLTRGLHRASASQFGDMLAALPER